MCQVKTGAASAGRKKSHEPHHARSDRCRGRRAANDRVHPAEQKAPGGSKAAPQVGILATCFGNRGAQLREGECTEEGKDRAHDPRGEHHGDASPFARHLRGLQEDSCADHGAHHDGRGSPRAQAAHKFQPLFAHIPPERCLGEECSVTGGLFVQEVLEC